MEKSEAGTGKGGITRGELLKAAAVAAPAFLLGQPAASAARTRLQPYPPLASGGSRE